MLDLITLDDIAGMDCRMLFNEESGLLYSGGEEYFTVTDIASNMELARIPVNGRCTTMRFGPNNKKLLV